MCRPRTGPRCSHSGRIRRDRANKHLDEIQQRHDHEKANGNVSARTDKQLRNARRRKDAALRVWEATPKGHEEIQSNIDQLEHKLTVIPEGKPGTPARREFNKTNRDLNNAKKRLAEGVKSRKDQYAGYHMTETERRALRQYAMAQGASINKRAQPSNQAHMDEALAANKAEALELRQWSDDFYDDHANSWVEKGTKTSWTANNRVQPPKEAKGTRVTPSTSKAVRLNLPDGQVVEGRADVHVTKNTKGQYLVSERLTVASSWEDAAPIDVTTQDVGHIIASKRGVNRKASTEVATFSSEAEAVSHAEKLRRRTNQSLVKDTARLGREGFVGRAHIVANPVMHRGFVEKQRYLGD